MLLIVLWIQPGRKLCSSTLLVLAFYLCISLSLSIKDGKTALMMAAQGGHTETVKALIEARADVNLICKQVIHSY